MGRRSVGQTSFNANGPRREQGAERVLVRRFRPFDVPIGRSLEKAVGEVKELFLETHCIPSQVRGDKRICMAVTNTVIASILVRLARSNVRGGSATNLYLSK